MNIKKIVKDFLKEEDGLTTVEYAVAGGVIASAIVVAFKDLGVEVKKVIDALVLELRKPAS